MEKETLKPSKTQQRVENHAKRMIQKFAIPKNKNLNPEEMCIKYYGKVSSEIKKYSPAILGNIAVAGVAEGDPRGTSMYITHHGTWLDKYSSGRSLLQKIATTVIIAKICDLVAK